MDSITARYHWTLEYILWGVSWVNLHLMIRDCVTYDYQTEKNNPAAEIVDTNDTEAVIISLKELGI